jgi:hypothetical protein
MGGGHGLIRATQLARPVTRSSLRLYSCGLIHMYYLSVSFSYLRSAAGVSFDIKKACRKPYKLTLFTYYVFLYTFINFLQYEACTYY